MSEQRNNQNKKTDEECPLCKVSEETLKRLKKKGDSSKKPGAEAKKKASWRVKALVLIFIVVLGVIAFYKFSPNFAHRSIEENNLNQKVNNSNQSQSTETSAEDEKSQIIFAPDFVSEDVDGNKFSLSDFRGKKPVLLIFWATWCGYCAKELPSLKAFTQEHQDEIQVIAVSSGEVRGTIRDYIAEEDINFLMLLDEQRKIWNQYLVRGTPTHFLVNKNGEVVTVFPGLASADNLETMLNMLP